MEKSNCCKTCFFAAPNYPSYNYKYECHRFPPKNAARWPDQSIQVIYPMVKETDWCGEYKKEN